MVAEKIHTLQDANLKEAGKIQKELINLEKDFTGKIQKQKAKETEREHRPLVPGEAEPGMRVYVASLDQQGTIESIESDGSSALVLFGGTIRSRFKIEDLFSGGGSLPATGNKTPRRQERKKKTAKEPPAAKSIPGTIQTRYNTIDLRGMRVEEALTRMGSDLDAMQRDNIDIAIIIHGHGTGALKNAVREALKMSIYVSDFRPGETGEGGDGVTVLRLRA